MGYNCFTSSRLNWYRNDDVCKLNVESLKHITYKCEELDSTRLHSFDRPYTKAEKLRKLKPENIAVDLLEAPVNVRSSTLNIFSHLYFIAPSAI